MQLKTPAVASWAWGVAAVPKPHSAKHAAPTISAPGPELTIDCTLHLWTLGPIIESSTALPVKASPPFFAASVLSRAASARSNYDDNNI